jgi:hypothetical protein
MQSPQQQRILSLAEARKDYETLMGCYILGETLADVAFKNAVGTKLVNVLRSAGTQQSEFVRLLTPDAVHAILSRHGATSRMLEMIAAAYAYFGTVDEILCMISSRYPVEFKNQVVRQLARMRARVHVEGAAAEGFFRF